MCDHAHYENLEDRVDDLDKRMCVIESTQNAMREEMRTSFLDVKGLMKNFYEERAAWSKWLRDNVNLKEIGKWAGRFIILVTLALIGFDNIKNVRNAISSGPVVGTELNK